MIRTVAIIPARGGSKGIPEKNLQTVGGIPLIVRAIQSCQNAKRIDLVIVSTDSEKIADVAAQAGAKVVRRPAELSTDFATSESALLHVISELRNESITPEFVAFIQCTTPFIEPLDIDGTVQLLESFDSAFTAAPTHSFIWKIDDSGAAVGVNHKLSERKMRQELSKEFKETGAVYALRTTNLLDSQHRFSGRIGIYVVPSWRAVEIDENSDLMFARSLETSNFRGRQPTIDTLKKIRAVVFDFDGVFTTNKVITSQFGFESVVCDRSDGLGIGMLKDAKMKMLILSKERNKVVLHRGRKLGIEVIQGCDNKKEKITKWLDKNCVDASDCAYIGNDINDLECMKFVGLPIAPSDAHDSVKLFAHWILSASGGNGAIREFADDISAALQGVEVK